MNYVMTYGYSLFAQVMAFDFRGFFSNKVDTVHQGIRAITYPQHPQHPQYQCPITKEHLEAARLCHKVYDDEFLHASESFVDSPSTDVQCSMTIVESKLYVVFRGSDDFTDWFHNLKMGLINYPANSKKQFHTGFLIQWLSVKDEVQKKINDIIDNRLTINNPIDTVVLTGHSAGCPPACLCALELEKYITDNKNFQVRVITFGSPRFSNHIFKQDFEAKDYLSCTRIVHDRDLVTRFPTSLYSEYEHVGKPIQLRGDHVLQEETSNFEAFRRFIFGILTLTFGVEDHNVDKYVEEIQSLLDKKKN